MTPFRIAPSYFTIISLLDAICSRYVAEWYPTVRSTQGLMTRRLLVLVKLGKQKKQSNTDRGQVRYAVALKNPCLSVRQIAPPLPPLLIREAPIQILMSN